MAADAITLDDLLQVTICDRLSLRRSQHEKPVQNTFLMTDRYLVSSQQIRLQNSSANQDSEERRKTFSLTFRWHRDSPKNSSNRMFDCLKRTAGVQSSTRVLFFCSRAVFLRPAMANKA